MAHIDEKQSVLVGNFLKNLNKPEEVPNFYSFRAGDQEIVADSMYPPLHHPNAINFFFFVFLHQHGFWYGDDAGYIKPLYGNVNGKRMKGSQLLWTVVKRAFDFDTDFIQPFYLAEIRPETLFSYIFRDDNGPIPFPDLETRFQLTRGYGRWFKDRGKQPVDLVETANRKEHSLEFFLETMRLVNGYENDLFQKKALLLAMALSNRPEQFLHIPDPEHWQPIIDYHVMRVLLRMGCVELSDSEKEENVPRVWVGDSMEYSVRNATAHAENNMIEASNISMPAVDKLIWEIGRTYCHEMMSPDCITCPVATVCKKRVELFQPVYRTTAY